MQVILGIACTVIIAAIALYQNREIRDYRIALAHREKWLTEWKSAHAKQRKELELWVLRFESLRAILPLHHEAARRGDARQCNALLAAAVAQANKIGAME